MSESQEFPFEVTPESIKRMLVHVGGTYPPQLGIEPVEITDTYALGRIEVAERHLHPGGLVHGGAWVGLGDTVAAWQTFRHLPPGYNFTSVEMKLNAFAAGKLGDEVIARAEHLHRGRSTHVIEVRMSCGDRLLANLIVTQFVLVPRGGAEGQA